MPSLEGKLERDGESHMSVGPFHLTFYGLAFVAGLLAAFLWVAKAAARRGISSDFVYDLALWATGGGVIGARAVHVVLEWPTYAANPERILQLQQGGLAWHGGLIGGAIGVWVATRRHGVSFLHAADLVAPALALGQAIGRVGCDIFGKSSTLPWAVLVNGQRVHPQQVYELLVDWVIFVFLSRRSAGRPAPAGTLLFLYLLLASFGRFWVEFFRNSTMVGFFSDGQWASLVGMLLGAVGLAGLAIVERRRKPALGAGVAGRESNAQKTPSRGMAWYLRAAVDVGTPLLLTAIYYWRVGAGLH
ncbi:MAG TPA: prolipoprotein diacylglyceryl transferase [Firmicutes bacterium]|nr:prolipoprotein diacylglyceryl transferase [Bacillota bacterium]